MISKIIETTIREKIKVSDGKQFQQTFWDIITLRYAGLQTPKMQHDLGSDGYSVKDKIFFACYAPESMKYNNKETSGKIESDYNSFCDNWKDKKTFDKWIFVTKDNLMGVPHQKLTDLNNLKDGVFKENWGLEQIIREVICLDNSHIVRIFNLPNSYIQTACDEKKDFGIITDIFEYLLKYKIPAVNISSIKESSNYTELTKKISLNFSDDELNTIKEMIFRNWEYKVLVERYITEETSRNPGSIDALIDLIQSDFRRIKNVESNEMPIENVRIIEDLARNYLQPEKQSNPDYVFGARAIILYFFELCFIGKKTDEEVKLKPVIF